ncbi:MAG: hypothetical protein F6K19_50415 [Cyanothece sp. SIO1E1]|nr:hypothetical protein [Cyanothece sp. SIO1E1]
MQLIDMLINFTFYGGLSYTATALIVHAIDWTEHRLELRSAQAATNTSPIELVPSLPQPIREPVELRAA